MTEQTESEKRAAENQAKLVIAGGDIAPDELLSLIGKLRKHRGFGLARRALEKRLPKIVGDDQSAKGKAKIRKLTQQLSLCTYKDPDLNPLERLDRALQVLAGLDDLELSSAGCTKDQESLGQAGAIFKRKWELTNQAGHLETSLAYYSRGYDQGVAKDFGYTGINAAFVLDLLASLEVSKADAEAKRRQAESIRKEIIKILEKLDTEPANAWLSNEWWFPVTIAEAYFGLKEFPQALPWLKQAAALPNIAEWEWETTARQFARLLQLLRLPEVEIESARKVLTEFLGDRAAGLDALLRGKVGLALSGGGFRASLFHIGTLAKLAELDLLRHVEYLSCVSGGSIIGAHYYLEVRKKLESKADGELGRDDYIAIVQKVQETFLQGVQTNIRVQVLSEWGTNVRMIWSPNYSRTNRLGELYEDQIFSRLDSPDGTAVSGTKLYLNALKVQPKDEDPKFSPKDQNWRRANKVPILILNATPLNTGHNWQFTATWMGEPPAGVGSEIDANDRLRRMYYDDAPPPHDEMRLGYAVAASSCVPGLFEPLPLTGLYPGRTVRLVDGGVHDNQGTAALLEQGCTVLWVSDASGQMSSQDDPSIGLLGVPLRSNDILQARVRDAQYRDLDARRRSGLLQGFMFIHLKQGLESRPVDWKDCQDPSDPVSDNPMLPYGIQRGVQERLAAMRTDLDSFTDAEAYALMNSAYRMTEHALANSTETVGFGAATAKPVTWKFLAIEEELRKPGEETPLMRQLKVADKLFLKVWFLSSRLKWIGIATIAAFLFVLAALAIAWWATPISFTWGQILSGVFVLALSATIFKPIVDVIQYRKTLEEILLGIGMAVLGSFLAKLHLKVFDKEFLEQGRSNNFRTDNRELK